jgi:Zn-dependent protease with chaperone function
LGFIEFAETYFASQPVLAALALLFSSLAFLLVLLRLERYSPRRRLRVLFASFAVEISIWSFLAFSLLFCRALLGLYRTVGELETIRTVFSLAILASLAVALPLAAFVTFKVPARIASRLIDDLPEPVGPMMESARRMARDFGVSALRVLVSPGDVPFAYSVGGAEPVVVVSKGLFSQLDDDEVETVLAHEFAHVKNHDTGLNAIIAVYGRVLVFDPFIRLLEGAIYAENEFSADELSARETGKPLSLASALLKISSGQSGGRAPPARVEGLSILGSGKILRPPSLKERIERLMRLASELEHEALLREHAPNAA